MQWGDTSFGSDKVSEFVGSGRKNLSSNLRFIKPLRLPGRKPHNAAMMNSRTMKLQSLAAIYARDRSPHIFQEMAEEMASMGRYDSA